jgi:protein-tyrosine phosphatase
MPESLRILPLAGASNFRDLGGYPTMEGGLVRWGRLFRSDSLHELTEGDIALLRDVGLRAVIDLRMGVEVERTGRGLLGAEAAEYFHLSVIDEDAGESRGIPAPVDDELAKRYLWYLEIGREPLVEALKVIADGANHPLVFHCAAGKDRTGVLAALVLDIVGVEREVIVDDYVLTASRMEMILDRLGRSMPEGKAAYKLPPNAVAVVASTMIGFFEGLDRQYGGARQWALSAGVPVSCLNDMARLLTTSSGG